MGLLHLLEIFKRDAIKRRASSCGSLNQKKGAKEIIEKRNSRRRSIMKLFDGGKKGQKETEKDISRFNVIKTHRKNSCSRMQAVRNGWLGKSAENSSITSVAHHQRNCDCCPAPRSGHRIFATEDFVYMIGGYHPKGRPDRTFTDIWRFNMLTEKWQSCSLVNGMLPDSLASFSLVQTDRPNEAYVFGGTGVPFGIAASNDLYRLNINNSGEIQFQKSIVTGEGSQKPPRMYGQAMCFSKVYNEGQKSTSVVYLVGGTTGHDYNMDVWRLQRSENSGEAEPSVWKSTLLTSRTCHNESGRYRLEVVLRKNQLITFGGGSPEFCAEFNELLTFDLGSQAFIRTKTVADKKHGYPERRKCHAIVEFQGEVYLIGGCRDVVPRDNGRRKIKMTNDVWKISLNLLAWTRLNISLPLPVFFHSAVVTSEGCVYVYGGCTDINSHSRTNKIFRMWLRPPSLRHLAMRAIRANPYFLSQGRVDDEMLLSQANQIIRNFTF